MLLQGIVWITLVITPILILLAFQFSFLAYHSHIATWTHRLLILVELAAFFLIWPLALNAQKEFQWPKIGADLKHLVELSWRLLGPIEQRRTEWQWLSQRAAPLAACLLFVIVSLSIATFPGEPHVNLFTLKPLLSVQCDRLLQQKFERIDLRFDRLDLPQVDVVDKDKLTKIVEHTSERKLTPSGGERTQNFRDRDFNCSDLSQGDLRRIDLRGARLVGVDLTLTALDGASLNGAELQGASLSGAELQGASLKAAQLQGADFSDATLDHLVAQNAWTWRGRITMEVCEKARVVGHKPDMVVGLRYISRGKDEPIPATPDAIAKFIESSVAEIPDDRQKEPVATQMRKELIVGTANNNTEALAKVWSDCEAETSKISEDQFDTARAGLLRDLVCDASANRDAIGQGIIRNWIPDPSDQGSASVFSVQLARGLLGEDGKKCAALQDFGAATVNKLRAAANATPVPATTPPPTPSVTVPPTPPAPSAAQGQ